MNELIVVSNRSTDESDGRPTKLRVRAEILADHGWNTSVVVVEDTIPGIATGIIRTLRELRRRDADVYLTMSNPPHLHLIGLLVSLFTSTPWLAEFRDPLVTIPDVDPESVSGRIRKIIEAATVKQTEQIVWCDGIQMPDEYLAETYGENDDQYWYKLPFLGYRSSKFEGVEPASFDPFTITYAGSFYKGWIEPYAFLDGFQKFVGARSLTPSDVQFLVYGDWNDDYTQAIRERNISEYVQTHDFVPHEEIIPVLKGSDVTVYIGGEDQRNRLSVPSKIWDYIGAGNPILVVADPEFRSAKFVEKEKVGVVADHSSPADIADQLDRLYDNEIEFEADDDGKFQRKRNIDEFASVLEAMLDGHPKRGMWHDQ